jgi:hypothetical protein
LKKKELLTRLERAKKLTDDLARLLARRRASQLASRAKGTRDAKRMKSADSR